VARLRSRVLRDDESAGRINKHTSSIIDAALVVLADGRPRTYIEIYTEALKAQARRERQPEDVVQLDF
jgi:hypothetical protein